MGQQKYEWMIKETQQTEWVEGQGMFIVVAFFLGGISGGLYLASLYFSSLPGMFISWLLALLMGVFYMLHLTKPLRFWRMVSRPQTSWISRGLMLISSFIVLVAIQLSLSLWLPGTGWEVTLKVLAGLMAFSQSIYTGFALSYVNAVKFWNSALLPILFVLGGLVGGFGILLAVSVVGNTAEVETIENILRALLVSYAIIIAVYFWNATYTDSVAKDSVKRLIAGATAPVFWGGVVVSGIVIPITISITSYLAAEASAPLLMTAVIFEIIGNYALRYSILKGGLYKPLIPVHL